MLSTIIRQSIQKSHTNNAILSMRSNWSNYYVCGIAFDATLADTFALSSMAKGLAVTTNPVVDGTRSLLRQMQGKAQSEGKPTNDIRFHVPVNREKGKKAK